MQKTGVWSSFPGGGHGNPPQNSCLENPMDRGAWWATVHGVAKSGTRLRDGAHTQHKVWRIQNYYSGGNDSSQDVGLAHGTFEKNEQGSLPSVVYSWTSSKGRVLVLNSPRARGQGARPDSVGRMEWDESFQLRCPVSRIMWWTDLESGHLSRSILIMKMIFVQSQMKEKADIPL